MVQGSERAFDPRKPLTQKKTPDYQKYPFGEKYSTLMIFTKNTLLFKDFVEYNIQAKIKKLSKNKPENCQKKSKCMSKQGFSPQCGQISLAILRCKAAMIFYYYKTKKENYLENICSSGFLRISLNSLALRNLWNYEEC